ncbi:sensor histidine kinase [Marinococcus sp. PL1-022]|uniref:sensor histidine kinase n=1 Tax=Marinococcus sp. PL1-022 TaxID=3095363 RepID=UPI0029C4E082|nr:sensor histidine kinase [Marinococcus sp. PL1-022]MDX6154163.1 sensor histidine kinase [Marinococcus sp. PL1-022]
MNSFVKAAGWGIAAALLISAAAVIPLLLMLPFDMWDVLTGQTMSGLPYVFLLVVLIVLLGTALGFLVLRAWNARWQQLQAVLERLGRGSSKTIWPAEVYREVEELRTELEMVERQLQGQAERGQKLATERAEDREKSLQEVISQERNRIARELHDSVSQQLFAASMMISAVNEQAGAGEVSREWQTIERMINQSQLEMRALLLHLRPAALNKQTLQEGIAQLLNDLTTKVPLQIKQVIEPFPIEKGVEDQLFRISQESISNTLRHAKATELKVSLLQREEFIILRVQDNGVGFYMEEEKPDSYGLSTMKERTEEIGGHFHLVSLPGEGSRIDVKVPWLSKGEEV